MGERCSGEIVDRNYWSDYLTKYPNATEIGSTGIGDTPYVFNATYTVAAGHQDDHPLMEPIEVLLPKPTPHPSLSPVNPVDAYASNLPPNIIQKLKPLGNKGYLNQGYLNQSERDLISSLEDLHEYVNSSAVADALDVILWDGGVTDSEVAAFRDLDHDFITNTLEIEKYHTDPTRVDTSGLGIDDFNAVFMYGLDPNDYTQIQQFLAAIPNVSASQCNLAFGGLTNVMGNEEIIEVSARDPLVQYYARHSSIIWNNTTNSGQLLVDGTPIWRSYGYSGYPAYYFTHGRAGICEDTTLATESILRLMGYQTIEMFGSVPDNGTMDSHVWCETAIGGQVYVVNYGELFPRAGFYQRSGWVISNTDIYDPDWYKK